MKFLNRIHPLYVSVPVVILFIAWVWFSLSVVNYTGGSPLLSLRTAGWFYISLPFTFGLAFLLGWIAAVMYRKYGYNSQGIILLALIACVSLSIRENLPRGQLFNIIGSKLAQDATIHRIVSHDTFNNGIVVYGELSGSDEFLEDISTYRSLSDIEIVPRYMFHVFDEYENDYGERVAHGDSYAIFYLSPRTGKIAFRYLSRGTSAP